MCFCPFSISMDLSKLRFFIFISERFIAYFPSFGCFYFCFGGVCFFLLSPLGIPLIWLLVLLPISSVSLNLKILSFIPPCSVLGSVPYPAPWLLICNHNAIQPTYCLACFPCYIFHMHYFHVHLYDFLLLLFLTFLTFLRVKFMIV